jgi:putative ABC transport system substrate-binding protein
MSPRVPVSRRALLGGLGALVADRAVAQERGPRRVAMLTTNALVSASRPLAAFREGLRDRGHVEGRDVVVDHRSADGRMEALPKLAAELAALRPAVFVAPGTVVVSAVRGAAPGVPVVALTGDLAAAGHVADFARPGSGVTGVSFIATTLDAKRLDLLAELLPRGAAVLNLADASARTGAGEALEATARARGLTVHVVDARSAREIEAAFVRAATLRVAGVNVLSSPLLNGHRKRIMELATSARLPAIYQWPETAEEGGLLGYGPRLTDIYRQLAGFVSRILRGAVPADLPVEQPTRFELVVNQRAAQAIGLRVPQSILVRADKVIE